MAAMKQWHVISISGCTIAEDKTSFSAGDSKTMYTEMKAKYDEINATNEAFNREHAEEIKAGHMKALPIWSVKRENY